MIDEDDCDCHGEALCSGMYMDVWCTRHCCEHDECPECVREDERAQLARTLRTYAHECRALAATATTWANNRARHEEAYTYDVLAGYLERPSGLPKSLMEDPKR